MFCSRVAAQDILLDHSYTAQQLAETLLDTDCEVQVSNATITGYNGSQGQSYAHFSLNYPTDENWPFTDGIILSSGYTASMVTPDIDTASSDGTTTWVGDADIAAALGNSPNYNATYLEFDFVSSVNYIKFKYFLTSEEFFSAVLDDGRDCSYNDGVAILIKPANGSQPYANMATFSNQQLPVCTANISYDYNCPFGVQNWALLEATAYYYLFSYGGETVVMTAVATIEPGVTYHVKIGVADGQDPGYDAAIVLGAANPDYSINLGEDRLLANFNPLCAGETLTLNSLPSAIAYKWYKNGSLLPGETTATYTVAQPGMYTSVATLASGCDYTGDIAVEYSPAIAQASLTYYQCDEDGDGLSGYYIALVGQEVVPQGLQPLYYYHTQADVDGNNPITISSASEPYYNTTPNEIIYVRVQNGYGCQAVIPIVLSATTPTFVTLPMLQGCPGDGQPLGFATFDLDAAAQNIVQSFPAGTTAEFYTSEADALLGAGALSSPYQNTTQGGETLYVRLSNAQGCYGIGTLPLSVEDFGGSFTSQTQVLCPDDVLTLSAGAGFVSYVWNTTPVQTTDSISVSEPGTYTVTVTADSGCTRSKTFTVFNSGPAQRVAFEINDFNGGHNSIAVLATGIGQYEYSLDGIAYRQDNVFEHLQPAVYTVYIQDANGCGPVLTDEVVILDYPTFFTPNGDGVGDSWRIPYMQHRPELEVTVFDRYGKLITTFNGFSQGWDGSLGGKPLPADDYWFSIPLEGGRIVRGHFALVR